MQHRQTTVIGAILAVMVVAVAVSLLVSLGILPAYNPGFSQPKSTATYVPQTCPPSGAKTVDVTTIEKINVYNGSETVGLAATVQQELEEAGLTVTSANDWPGGIYNGEVQRRDHGLGGPGQGVPAERTEVGRDQAPRRRQADHRPQRLRSGGQGRHEEAQLIRARPVRAGHPDVGSLPP